MDAKINFVLQPAKCAVSLTTSGRKNRKTTYYRVKLCEKEGKQSRKINTTKKVDLKEINHFKQNQIIEDTEREGLRGESERKREKDKNKDKERERERKRERQKQRKRERWIDRKREGRRGIEGGGERERVK